MRSRLTAPKKQVYIYSKSRHKPHKFDVLFTVVCVPYVYIIFDNSGAVLQFTSQNILKRAIGKYNLQPRKKKLLV